MQYKVHEHSRANAEFIEAESMQQALMKHRITHGDIGVIYCYDPNVYGSFSCIPNVCDWSAMLINEHAFYQEPVEFV